MSRFKHYLEVATGMQVADPATIAKEANTVAVETGTRKLNTMFNYYQQRI